MLGQTLVAKPIERTRLKALDAASEAKSLVSDTLHRVDTVKAYSLEETMVQRTVAKLDAFFHLDLKSNRVYCAVVPCGFVCAFLPSMLLYVVAIALAIRGTVSVGQLMAMVSLTTNVDSILLMLGQLMANVRTQSAGSQRIFGLWDAPQEKRGSLRPAKETGDAVRLEGLCFGYDPQRPLIEDMTLSIEPGERVAVVGASGSGKSTLLKLIAGLYAPQAGRIMVDGRDAEQMGVDELRTRLSYMSQDSHIFRAPCGKTWLMASRGPEMEIAAKLRDAGLGDWLAGLPQGLDTPLGDMGSILSGGQRQRISMARCMIHDAPLFLLDEATSALDNQTEREVLETLGKLLEGKSALLVTHRLSALRGITRVLVLDKGRIVEDGAPQVPWSTGGSIISCITSSRRRTYEQKECGRPYSGCNDEADRPVYPADGETFGRTAADALAGTCHLRQPEFRHELYDQLAFDPGGRGGHMQVHGLAGAGAALLFPVLCDLYGGALCQRLLGHQRPIPNAYQAACTGLCPAA